ncbi:MarR family winged helix-turn-helix transcriptional regulator [Flagellimonas sp.]|uniref:MarR family winged helix-turn-helix transcriptional regulator n=1 Tax=Flagellimonas sp. TaxID=2058762 RepID=UPI003B50A6CD
MKDDYFKQLHYLGLTARLKRISDNLLYSAKDLYKSLDMDIEPNWHLVFLMFKSKDTLTMTEIADAFKLSQPAIIKMINKMKSKGYLISTRDSDDHRKFLLKLSEKAKKELPNLERIFRAGEKTIKDIIAENESIFDHLTTIESAIAEKDFKQRMLTHLENDKKSNSTGL